MNKGLYAYYHCGFFMGTVIKTSADVFKSNRDTLGKKQFVLLTTNPNLFNKDITFFDFAAPEREAEKYCFSCSADLWEGENLVFSGDVEFCLHCAKKNNVHINGDNDGDSDSFDNYHNSIELLEIKQKLKVL